MIKRDSLHSNRDLNIFHAITIAMPINIPIKHRLLTDAANSGSSVKKESTKPKIPVKKIMMTPHPRAALVAPKGAFFIVSPLFEPYRFLSFPQSASQLFSPRWRVFVIPTSAILFNSFFKLVCIFIFVIDLTTVRKVKEEPIRRRAGIVSKVRRSAVVRP